MNQEHPTLLRATDTIKFRHNPPWGYYVALTFHPNQVNPARPSGRGVYRVHHSGRNFGTVTSPCARPLRMDEGEPWINMLYLTADREYKVRSRVDPKKIALAVLSQRRA